MEPTTLHINVFRPQALDSTEWDNAIAAALAAQTYMKVADWGDRKQTNQNISIRIIGPVEGDMERPALSFLASWLLDRGFEASAANGVARLTGCLSDLLGERTMPSLSIGLSSGYPIQIVSGRHQKLS